MDPGEICDGNCPTSCDDGNACTTDTLTGSAATCDAQCSNTPITSCVSGDGCCPSGCTSANDSDCGTTGGGVDLSGTWIAQISSPGSITAPVVGTQSITITVVQRLVVTKTSSGLSEELQICSLDTSGSTFSVIYPQAAIDTLDATQSTPDVTVNVGDMVPVPDFTIYSGEDSNGNPVDSDGDGTPGIFVTAQVAGVLNLPSDIGIAVNVSVNGSLTDANTLSGTVSFGTDGTVYDISGSAPTGDPSLTVTTSQPTIPFTATKLAGNVPCSQVLTMFP